MRQTIDLFTIFFSTFDMDKFGKIRRHHWKGRLKISKISKFESDLLRSYKDTAPQSREILQTFVWGGGGGGGGHKLFATPPYKPLQIFAINLRSHIFAR